MLKRRRNRTDIEYLSKFKEYVVYSKMVDEEITHMNFCRWSKSKCGVSMVSTIMQALKRGWQKIQF